MCVHSADTARISVTTTQVKSEVAQCLTLGHSGAAGCKCDFALYLADIFANYLAISSV